MISGMGLGAGLISERPVSGAELGEELINFRHEIDMMELAFSLRAAEFAATDEWDLQGSVSAIDWIRFNCHMTGNAAADRVAVGERMAELPESLQAMAATRIGYAHLTVMVRTANAVGDRFDECWSPRLARAHRASSFTSAVTTGMQPTPRAMPQSRRSWWRTAGSRFPPGRTARCC